MRVVEIPESKIPDYESAAAYLLSKTGVRPQIGVICGSGLSGLSACIENPETIYYKDIPEFPRATVAGHKGEMVFGTINGISAVCMRGRFHYYEGNSMAAVAMPVRVMRLLGVRLLIVTNASGALNPSFNIGDICVVQDHFGAPTFTGTNPLVGENNDNLGPRFPAVTDSYCETLQAKVKECATSLNLTKKLRTDCTYCYVSGPNYESRAECRFLRMIKGDCVGMSTIPEVIAAKHVGMKILCLSLITNKVVCEKDESETEIHASHEEVLGNVQSYASNVLELVRKFISKPVVGAYLEALPVVCYMPRRSRSGSKDSINGGDISYPSNPVTEGKVSVGTLMGTIGEMLNAIHIPTLITATAISLSFSYVYFQKKA